MEPRAPERPRVNLFLQLFAIPLGLAAVWFLYKVSSGLLLLFLAMFVAIGLNGPVVRLQRRGWSPHSAALLVLLAFFSVIALVCWMVLPKIAEQLVALINSSPDLLTSASKQLSFSLRNYPDLQRAVQINADTFRGFAPEAFNFLVGVGGASFEVLKVIASLIVFFASIFYLTLNPRPLLVRYFSLYSDRLRPRAMRGFVRFSAMVAGWMRANVILGSIEAVLSGSFLTVMNIPGALVWAALAFFAEFIPRLGGYIMATPPVLIALSVSPMTALWVALFYLVMNESLGSFIAPQINSAEMSIHPFLIILSLVVLALAFGFMGALVATPFAALVLSHVDEFRSPHHRVAANRLIDEEKRRHRLVRRSAAHAK